MESKAKQFQKRLPIIQQLEFDLGLPEDIKDSELTAVQSTMENEMSKAKLAIRNQAIAEQKAKDDMAPKKEEPYTPINE